MQVSSTDDVIERLAAHRTLGGAPREELEWLAAHAELHHLAVGDVVVSPSAPVSGMYIVLSGRLSLRLVRAGTQHKLTEWRGGDVTGLLPYSRLNAPPGNLVVDEPADVLFLPGAQLPAMTRECHQVTSILVHVMLDRTRFFTSAQLHDEKLRSLGKLAAGLAHELNNPAAAISRSAKVLPDAVAAAESAARALGAAGLTPGEAEAARQTSAACEIAPVQQVRSPIEEAEREAAIGGWLEARGIDPVHAEALAQSPMPIEALQRLAGRVRPRVLETVLVWVAADSSARSLAREIEQAATRISDLVTAVRGFTRVDESAVPQPVSLAEGLAQTLAVLKGKARGKSIKMTIEVEEGTPPVHGVAAELNQVWANLIDNALDAAPPSGRVEVKARAENGVVVVRVADDGPGIPAEVRERIFDPFFTTKDVGKGTGLGLDIVRRLVERHDGDIEVRSRPGRTEFIVSLPAAGNTAHGPDLAPEDGA